MTSGGNDSKWISGSVWSFLAVTEVVLVVLAVSLVLALGPEPDASTQLTFELELVSLYLLVAMVFLVAWMYTWPKRIGVSQTGVTFVTRLRIVRVEWGDIVPPPRKAPLGGWTIECRELGVGDLVGYFNITDSQTRSLLTHASCPPWDIPPWILARLDLEAAPVKSTLRAGE